MGLSHHNTTHETGLQLDLFNDKAKAQEEKILGHFRNHPDSLFAPHDILHDVFQYKVLITSVRRAITNLTERGHLVKTNVKTKGPEGRPVYTWKLNKHRRES